MNQASREQKQTGTLYLTLTRDKNQSGQQY